MRDTDARERWHHEETVPGIETNWACIPVSVAVQREAEAALLARRAPGDAGLREAIDAELALLGDEPRNQFESGAAAAYHWVLAHLRADSRPEHGVPHTVYLKPGEQAAVIRAPRRADPIVFDFEEESAPVRPEEPPE